MKRPSLARANARLLQIVSEVHAQVDAHHAKPSQQHDGVQCRDGCAHAPTGCCSLITLSDAAEADYVVARNREHIEQLLPALQEAHERISARISVVDVIEMFRDRSGKREKEVAAVYHELGVTCPFLSAERRCTIYRDRPLACRTHFVLSPPELCSTVGVEERHVTLDKGTRIESQAMLAQHVVRERGGRVPTFKFGIFPQLVLHAFNAQRQP